MYVLGLSSYSHEASCALLKDGAIVALGEEERFNRKKHTSEFPAGAIRDCLVTPASISTGISTTPNWLKRPSST